MRLRRFLQRLAPRRGAAEGHRSRPQRHRALIAEGLEARELLATFTVSGQANIFGAGLARPPAPGGGGAGVLPVKVDLSSLGNPRGVSFPSVTGGVSGWAARGGYNGPDGGGAWGGVSNIRGWNGISGIFHNRATMFLVGVFLGPNGQPTSTPPRLDVTNANSLSTFSPQIGQQFYIGDGQTSAKLPQRFNVPAGATALYLGFAESWGFGNPNNLPGFYGDNDGRVQVQVAAAASPPQNDIAVRDIPSNTAGSATVLYSVVGNPGPFLVRVFRSADRVLDSGDVLAGSTTINPTPNVEATRVVPFTPIPTVNDQARPFLIAVADPATAGNPGGAIPETNEGNNSFVVSKYASRRDATKLGTLSEREESGGRGPGTISSGVGDPGGVSYGIYQFSSKPNGGTVQEFVNASYQADFSGLVPGTTDFNNKWAQIAREQPTTFRNAQHAFIKKRFFDVTIDQIRSGSGLTSGWRSNTFLDVVWSTSVQHGPTNGAKLIQAALGTLPQAATPDKIDDFTLIRAIYNERGRKDAAGKLVYFSKVYSQNPPDLAKRIEASLVARFQREFKQATTNLLAEI